MNTCQTFYFYLRKVEDEGTLSPVETPPEQHEDLSDLIQWIKDTTGDSESAIARRIGVAPATVNNWLHRKRGTGRGPARKNLTSLAAAYRIPENRVFAAAGRAKPGPLSPQDEAELLELYRNLTEEQQRMKLLEMRALGQHNRSRTSGV